MKKLFLVLTATITLLSSCQKPHFIEPTAERDGLTSLTAYFTFGPFVDQEMAKLTITDENATRFSIPIPYYYPETSDDETQPYLLKARVKAELQPNCYINPPLTILDLTQENHFTYTNAKGVSRDIVITGERVKSNKCELISFSIVDPQITGVIDKAAKKVSLIYLDELLSCSAVAEISAHATISPDPATLQNYDEGVVFTVTAHDGVTKAQYRIEKDIPEKIAAGFNKNSVEQLFNIEPVSSYGVPDYTSGLGPSLAVCENNLVVCYGNGSAPILINKTTGVMQGTLNLGSAIAGSITSDEAEHLLIVNHAQADEYVNIYKSYSVNEAPTLLYSFINDLPPRLPMGTKMKVFGNIDSDANIVITHEGVDGITEASTYTLITIRDGEVLGHQQIDLAGFGLSWGSAPVTMSTVVAAGLDPAEGTFSSYYGGGAGKFTYARADGSVIYQLGNDSTGWGLNANCLDSKRFNNVDYVALFVVSHFPPWGMGPQLYLMDVNDKSRIAADNVWSSPALVLANNSIEWYQKAAYDTASGDVIISPSADGFKLYIYYYDLNSSVIGGYSADCISR